MNDFTFYFAMGWNHIISPEALDHLLFILVLACIYSIQEWKKLLILITAFTIGHSITLVLSTYHIISISSSLVEFLIPITIALTATYNLLQKPTNTNIRLNYLMALSFGLIHGLGFANTIRFMLAPDQAIGLPLFAFNVGLEIAQVIIVTFIICIIQLLKKIHFPLKWWTVIISTIVLCIAIWMAVERWPLLNNIR